jgi:hypothetical protein
MIGGAWVYACVCVCYMHALSHMNQQTRAPEATSSHTKCVHNATACTVLVTVMPIMAHKTRAFSPDLVGGPGALEHLRFFTNIPLFSLQFRNVAWHLHLHHHAQAHTWVQSG